MKPERCIGSLHGPAGDCLSPIAGGLVCYGYYDPDEAVALEDSITGPVPMLFPACSLHRPALIEWAEHLWGDIANGMWVPPEAFDRVKRHFSMDADPLLMSPNPRQAVGINAA